VTDSFEEEEKDLIVHCEFARQLIAFAAL